MNRLAGINNHFSGEKAKISSEKISVDGKEYPEIIDFHPDREIKIFYFNKQGWGYTDSGFEYLKDKKQIKIKGNRYMFGGQILPKFSDYITEHLKTDLSGEDPPQDDMANVAPPNINHAFLEELGTQKFSRRSFMKWERIMHSHGACLQEVW